MPYTLLLKRRRNRVLPLARYFVVAMIVSGFAAGAAWAQTVDPTMWSTNGSVSAIATAGNTIYLGGSFSYVGPSTGHFAAIDVGTGALDPGWPRVNGTVYCSAADGAGGWYIAGEFTSVGGAPRTNLAHIREDKTLDAWNPGSDEVGTVHTLAVSGSTVYAGGGFNSIGGQSRSNLAALDAATGLATAWNPGANGVVNTLAVSGSTVYAGGGFTSIGGQSRSYIAALDATTGLATAWNPGADNGVLTLAVSGSTVYACGFFTGIGGQSRSRIAALDAINGLATAWNPGANDMVFTLAVSGSTVYAGGLFTVIGGQSRNLVAALDASTGFATAWNPGSDDIVFALEVSGSTVYAGGSFTSIGGQSRNCIAALDATTGLATAWNPGADARVLTLAVGGSTVYAGGWFTIIGGQSRSNIAALDASTGLANAWDPAASGLYGSVSALAVSGSTVYAGGSFTDIGGQSRSNLAALDATTGLATAWNPGADGWVLALAVSGSTVYAGGAFTSIGGQSRSHIAALDATSGLATAWNPGPNGGVFGVSMYALAANGSTVYAGGEFTSIGGQSRDNIAALDATTGLATAWNPGANRSVYTLTVSGSTVYAGGDFFGIGGQSRRYIAALDATTGIATAWNPGADWNVNTLAVSGSAVYVGGGFTSIGGQSRSHIAALDATTGLATAWNPGADNGVLALAVSGLTLYAGGHFTRIGGQSRGGFAAITIQDLPTPTLLTRFEAEQTSAGVQLRWQFGEPGRVVDAALERSTSKSGPWRALALESHRMGDAMEAFDATVTGGETYYYRLVANLTDGTRAVFGPVSTEALATVKVSGITSIAPNPTSNSARIDFALVRQEKVRISVVDVTGREAAVLADGPMAPGSYSMLWDGRRGGARLAAGVYYVRWASAERSMSRKLVMMP